MIRPSLIRLFLTLSSVALPLAVAQTETVADPNVYVVYYLSLTSE